MGSSLRRLALVSGGVFLVALLLHLPAALAIGWSGLSETLPMQGVTGTVWSGGARAASVQLAGERGQPSALYLGRVRWRFQPLSLFLGRVEYLIEADGPTIAGLRGRVSPAGQGGVRMVGTRGRARIDAVAPLIAAVPMLGGLSGTVDFDLAQVVLAGGEAGGWPKRADGTLQLRSVSVPLLGGESLGDFTVEFRSDATTGNVLVDYRDLNTGPLSLEGTATLSADGSVQRECTASARPGAPATLAQASLICSNDLF